MNGAKCWTAKYALGLLAYLVAVLIWHEFLIYYLYLGAFCRWPVSEDAPNQLKALVLADTHLLGTVKGHWLDKLRREWQMQRSFQAALTLFSPKAAFMLGDIFDEGQWASNTDFDTYVKRFYTMFTVPKEMQMVVVTGNHDIGFHYRTNSFLNRRFNNAMNATTVDHIVPIEGVYFVRINSIAMEMDGCALCSDAIRKIKKLSLFFEDLRKSKDKNAFPIVLTHFPMYRLNEWICNEEDSIPEEEKNITHRTAIDCLSKEASEFILEQLKPRLILNGHVHHSCHVRHPLRLDRNTTSLVDEWTVASFSWRNKANPSFLLLQVTDSHYAIRKCFLPNEYFVIGSYLVAVLALLLYILALILRIKRKND